MSVRRLVDLYERGAFSQADLSVEELSQHNSFSQLSQHASTQPEWMRMFEMNQQFSVTLLFQHKPLLKCTSPPPQKKMDDVSDHFTHYILWGSFGNKWLPTK